MRIHIRAKENRELFCPRCGGDKILGIGQEYCHCGHCGAELSVEYTEEVTEADDRPEFEQMSLF